MTGKYSCKVTNAHGSAESECQVTVNCKPRVKKSLKDIEVAEGETLSLDVEIYGMPEPKIVWLKDGQEVRTDARIKISRDSQRLETYNLTLNLVKEADSGEYEVRATNNLGTVSSKSKVIVTSKIYFYLKLFFFFGFLSIEEKLDIDFGCWTTTVQ